jgi:bifunctional non-homologous end joining protein LigD
MGDRLTEYRRKRDAARTPEPVPAASPTPGRGNAFVVQQHHARALHWDLRLERDGVLVSWAVPAASRATRRATTSRCRPRTTRWST